jgi:serine/threonine protein kinase
MYRGPDGFLHQVVGGRWRLLEILCATAHGTSFRVETLEDGRPARLELWDQRHVEGRGELARFEREARTLSRLRHEHCFSVVAFGAHEGLPFLVSELPEGKALRDELGKSELPLPRVLSLGLQLCEGLRHLHRHGVVHRALLPENVWVARSPAADLLKIGLPRIGQPTDASGGTRERFYRPPGRSAARPDHRADLYAVGALLYVMCTGREPPEEVMAATAAGAPMPPPRAVGPERGISEGLERVILRALAPSPQFRFGTADELVAALQSAGARPPNPRPRPTQGPRKRSVMFAAAFVTVALAGAGALRSSGGPQRSTSPAAPPAQPAQPAQPAPLAQPSTTSAKAAVEPRAVAPAPPRVAMAAPPVDPHRETAATPVPAPAAPAVAASSRAPLDGERGEIWSLLDSGRLDEGAARIKRLVYREPDAAWPRFALGVLYYRRYWRRAAVKEWGLAVAHDRAIQHDPQFGAYLCFMLDDDWKAAGMTELLAQLGAEAAPLLDHCVASAKSPRLRSQASGALEDLRRADHPFGR